MKLYHGSKKYFKHLEARQATTDNPNLVPADEVLKAIYLTPDYGRAVAMCCMLKDSTIFIDNDNHKITFEKPELFNPNEDVYIYSLNSEIFSEDELKLGENGLDYIALVENRTIEPEVKKIKAREVLDYYEITNWKENNEISNSFKMK